MIVNLTPHSVVILADDGKTVLATLPPSGGIARSRVEYTRDGEVDGLPAYRAQYGAVEGLPSPEEGNTFLVSGLVAAHPSVAGRTDVVAPGDLVRGADGQPTGCKGLKRA